ncbi:MAG: hypothetical protein NWR58_00555 [Candidatus Nanopelagicales bacterium]|nr:hypothetical protein [Candidatus Nanopelagicales bacterium]
MGKVVYMLMITRVAKTSVLSLLLFLTFAQSAQAVIRDDGDEPGEAISGAAIIILFVGIPLLILGLIALAILAPQWSRRARRESGFISHSDTWWLNGPGNEAKHKEIESSTKESVELALKVGGVSAKW